MGNKLIRQGDVLLVPVTDRPRAYDKREWMFECTIALGEATGHHHTIYPPRAEVPAIEAQDEISAPQTIERIEWNGRVFVEVPDGFWLRHQEHDEHEIPGGMYEIIIEQEYDPLAEEMKQVVD